MRHPKPLLPNILIVLVSLTLSLLSAECALRFTDYRYLTILGWPHETRGYLYADEKAGTDIQPNYPKRTIDIEPRCTQVIWSNEIGCFDMPYRGEKDYCLLLGDSFAFGIAPFQATWGKVLDDLIGVRVVKCGVCGYGTRQELIKGKKTVALLRNRPRIIVLAYFIGNDLVDDLEFPSTTVIDGYPVKVNTLNTSTGIVAHSDLAELRRLVEKVEKGGTATEEDLAEGLTKEGAQKAELRSWIRWWLRSHSVLYNLFTLTLKKHILSVQTVRSVGIRSGAPPQYIPAEGLPWLKRGWEKHLENLKLFQAFASQNDSKLLVVIIPEKQQVYRSLWQYPTADYLFPDRILAEFFQRQGIAYIDLLPLFQKYANPAPRIMLDSVKDLYWRFDVHLNIKGNRLAALLVAQYMLEHGFLDGPDRDRKLHAISQELSAFR